VRYCKEERTDFPNSEFRWNEEAGEEYHYPPGQKKGHPSGGDGNGNGNGIGLPLPEPPPPNQS
jgi:hypothetical protein